jgi:hypothetical protein
MRYPPQSGIEWILNVYTKKRRKMFPAERAARRGPPKSTVPSRLPSKIGASRVNPSKLRVNRSAFGLGMVGGGIVVWWQGLQP